MKIKILVAEEGEVYRTLLCGEVVGKTELLASDEADEEIKSNEQDERIGKILRDLGIPVKLRGYSCLKAAIAMTYDRHDLIYAVTKELYPRLEDRFNMTVIATERNIRTAIETGWNRGNLDLQDEVFGYSVNPRKGMPTNTEFISAVTEYIRKERGGSA